MAKSKSMVLNTTTATINNITATATTTTTNAVVDVTAVVEVASAVEPVKGKRGRKSKKELMAALNMDPQTMAVSKNIVVASNPVENVTLNVTELNDLDQADNFYENDINVSNIVIITNPNLENDETDIEPSDVKQVMKKRGRKPKGGKIIQQVIPVENQANDKPNVILHLKCSMKDLQNSANVNNVDSYAFASKNDLCYDVIGSENINSINTYYNEINNNIKTIKNIKTTKMMNTIQIKMQLKRSGKS
jgi:hypothetical protein